jgi:hypothetical protein
MKEMSLGDHDALQFTCAPQAGQGDTRGASQGNWLCYRKNCAAAHADPTGLIKDD